jgi:hypothetical protein
MDDLNEMANLHSAGAIVQHPSPFTNLSSHKNETSLTADFIKKWVVPFYMEIGKPNDTLWIEAIVEIKGEIDRETCLLLLGEFNWRTRLVGAYFAAVKNYDDLTDIIGIHLLKSEVCCVGHIYALVLAFFNTYKSVGYLEKYLDYYLTTPGLYFDQQDVMQSLLYLDQEYGTDRFKKKLDKWNLLEENRRPIERQKANSIARLIESNEGKIAADDYLREIDANSMRANFSTLYFEEQISILRELNQHST